MPWQIGLISSTVVMAAYLGISLAIVVPLVRSNQLRSNPLGGATAAIFLTCAVHHAAYTAHLLLPSLGATGADGTAVRSAWSWPLAISDVIGAVVAAYYWSLRRNYSLMEGARLFQDLREREQRALELHDSVLQGLVVAKMALDLDQPGKAQDALAASIDSASRIITGRLGSEHPTRELLRSSPVQVGGPQPQLQRITDELPLTAADGTSTVTTSTTTATHPDRTRR